MKLECKYYTLFFVALIILLSSMLYRENKANRFVGHYVMKQNSRSVLELYYYFFGLDCDSCRDAISYLNELSRRIPVTGIIVEGEVNGESLKKYGIRFPVKKVDDTGRRFKPGYIPALVGVTSNRVVVFMQPGVPSYDRSNHLIYDVVDKLNQER